MSITRIIIHKDGKITIEGIGYVGKECLKDLKTILELLKQYGIDTDIETQELKQEAKVEEVEKQVIKS